MYTKNILFFLVFLIIFPLYSMEQNNFYAEEQNFLIVEDLSLLDAAFCPQEYLGHFNQARQWILDPHATSEQLGLGVQFIDNLAKIGCAPAQVIRGHIARILNDHYGYQHLLVAAANQGFRPAMSEVHVWNLLEVARPVQIGPDMFYQDPIAKMMLEVYEKTNFNPILQPDVAKRIIESYNNTFFTPVCFLSPEVNYSIQCVRGRFIDNSLIKEAAQEICDIYACDKNKMYQKTLKSISQEQEPINSQSMHQDIAEKEVLNKSDNSKSVWNNSEKLDLVKKPFSLKDQQQKTLFQPNQKDAKVRSCKRNKKVNKQKPNVASVLLNSQSKSKVVCNNSNELGVIKKQKRVVQKESYNALKKPRILKEDKQSVLEKNNKAFKKESEQAVELAKNLVNKTERKNFVVDAEQEKNCLEISAQKEVRVEDEIQVELESEKLKKSELLAQKTRKYDVLQKSFEKIQRLSSYAKGDNRLLSEAFKGVKTIFLIGNAELKKQAREYLLHVFSQGLNFPYSFYYKFCEFMLPLEENLALSVLSRVETLLGAFTGNMVDVLHDDLALYLFQSSGVYELMNEKATGNPQAAYLLGVILSDRANSDIKICNGEDITKQYIRALELFESNNNAEKLSQITYVDNRDIETLYIDTLLNLVDFLLSKRLFDEAIPYLKKLIDKGNLHGQLKYNILIVNKIVDSTKEQFDSSMKFLENALTNDIFNQHDKESACIAIWRELHGKLEVEREASEIARIREQSIRVLTLANMNDLVSKVEQSLEYYTLDEIDQRSKNKHDPKSLYEQGLVCLNKKNYEVAEVFFIKAAEGDVHLANFELAKMIEKHYISGDWKKIKDRLEMLTGKLINNYAFNESKSLFINVLHWLSQKKDIDDPYAKYLYVKNKLLSFIYGIEEDFSDNEIEAVLCIFSQAEKLIESLLEQQKKIDDINNFRLSILSFMEKVFDILEATNKKLAAQYAEVLGLCEGSRDCLLEAIKWMEKALELNPELESVYATLSLLHVYRADDFIERDEISFAHKELDKACKYSNDTITPYIARSNFYFEHAHTTFNSKKYHELCVKKGTEDLLKAASISAEGKCSLAHFYYEGKKVGSYTIAKNIPLALKYYIEAAEEGCLDAQIFLYNWYSDEDDIDFEKAEKYFHMAMNNPSYDNSNGAIETLFGVFNYKKAFHCQGKEREDFFCKAFESIKKGIIENKDDNEIQLVLGAMYLFGHGVELSLDNALDCFEQGVDEVFCNQVLTKHPLNNINLIEELEKYKGNIRVDYILGVYYYNEAIQEKFSEKRFDYIIKYFEDLLEKIDKTQNAKKVVIIYSCLAHAYFCKAQNLEIINMGNQVDKQSSNIYLYAVRNVSRLINFVYKEQSEPISLFKEKIKDCMKLFSEQRHNLLLIQNVLNKASRE